MNNPVKPKQPAKLIRWRKSPVDFWTLLKSSRGILVIGFAVMVVNRISGLVLPASMKYLLDDIMLKKQLHLLTPFLLAVLGATAVQGVTSYWLAQLMSKSAQLLTTELRIKLQAHVGRLPIAFYDTNKTGVLISRIMSDIEGVRNLFGAGLVEFAGGIITASFALIYLFRTSVIMTTVACVWLIIFTTGLSQAFKFFRKIYRSRSEINAEVTGRLTESLNGVRIVKGYHAEEREERVFFGGAHRILDTELKTLTATSLVNLSAPILAGVTTAAIALIGTNEVLSGRMTPGSFFAYTMFLGLLVGPVAQIVSTGPQIAEALAGLDRTRELLNQTPEDEDPARTLRLGRVQGLVQFENVSFSYDSKKPVLYEVNFKAKPDTVTALVGPSGAGKSTIIGLIAAFYKPTSGRALVDYVDLARVRLDSFRTQLGIVLQESFLFDGTIRENVAFGCPSATEEEVLTACRMARVDEFAETFEKKYDTTVGERGVKLAGGQKQRVSIARAILADPRILILDEATSSLDSESEALIQEGLRFLMRGRTTFVIAHRLSTIKRADQILVLEAGRVIERGTHESLYAAGGRYYDLYTKQHGLAANLFVAPGETAGDLDESRRST